MSPNAIIVGSMDSTPYDATNDQKATYSETGPGVDIFAPGTDIMSATSTTNKWGGGSQNYYANSSYKQTNISGTSMATPQVAGVAALILQLNPTYTPAQVKASLLSTSTANLYTTSNTTDYSNTRSLLGAGQTVLYANYDEVPVPQDPIFCYEYRCLAANGGYLYWTDCATGNKASTLLNSGKAKFISSRTYPEFERGAQIRIKEISSTQIN